MTESVKDYDSSEEIELRKNQEDPIVMYLVVRESLNMSSGKIGAQCGHAAQMILMDYVRHGGEVDANPNDLPHPGGDPNTPVSELHRMHVMFRWLDSSFRKVTLKADEKEWRKLKEIPGLSFVVVKDAGHTEVAPGSETVIGIWPMYRSQRPKLLKNLQALK